MKPAPTGFWTIGRKGRRRVCRRRSKPNWRRSSKLARQRGRRRRALRRFDLKRVIKERFGVDYHERHVGTLLKRLGFSTSARARAIRGRTRDRRGL